MFLFFHIYSKLNHSIGSFVNVDETIHASAMGLRKLPPCSGDRAGNSPGRCTKRTFGELSWYTWDPYQTKKAHSENELVGGFNPSEKY